MDAAKLKNACLRMLDHLVAFQDGDGRPMGEHFCEYRQDHTGNSRSFDLTTLAQAEIYTQSIIHRHIFQVLTRFESST